MERSVVVYSVTHFCNSTRLAVAGLLLKILGFYKMDSLGGQVDQRGFSQEIQNKFYANFLLSFLQHHFNSILALKNPSHDKKIDI